MINYKILGDSVEHYETNGYVRVEAPWTVSEQVENITRPDEAIAFQLVHNDKCLVASGEQSFLYLYLKDFLPKGQFQTITPCFRYEAFDFLHTKYFMKNELIKTDLVNTDELEKMINLAMSFYRKYFPASALDVSNLEDGSFDIVLETEGPVFELGSYGIRTCQYLEWIYGTGCAEPRLSNLIKMYGLSQKNNR